MSAFFSSRPQAITFNIRQRRERWLSPLNLHWAGVGLLGLVCLYLLVRMVVLYQEAKNQNADALNQQQLIYQTALQTGKPLEGIDAKLRTADQQADTFYAERLPVSYSEIASKLGALALQDHVRLANNQYGQKPVDNVSVGQLTEVQMDASLSGDYRGLVEFLNGLERSRIFFVIRGVTLTGQQGGKVNLRIHFFTYLRGLSSDEEASRASTPVVSAADDAASQAAAMQAARGKGGHR